jgi:hypothetical protein
MIQTAQPSDILIWVAAISAASAITSAVLVGYVNYHTNKKLEQQRFENNNQLEKQRIEHVNQLEKQKIEYTEYQRRQQTYSQLMGRQRAKMQFYAGHFNAQINANYYDLLSIIDAISRIDYDHVLTVSEINASFIHERVNSNFYKEQQIERERIADYMLLSAGNSKQFFTTIGLIKVLFSNTQEMRDLIKEIEKSLGKFSLLNAELDLEYNKMASSIMASEIHSNAVRDDYVDKWTSDINSKKTKDIERYFSNYTDLNSKIDNLLKYLEKEMEKEALAQNAGNGYG